MFNNLKGVFKDVYLLAKERRLEEEVKSTNGIIVEDFSNFEIEDLAYSGKEKELFDLLDSLDFESVKIIQTIMYIGRDHYYNESDSYEMRYNNYRKTLDFTDKEIEISQIVQKVPLDKYLKDGFDILGIKL